MAERHRAAKLAAPALALVALVGGALVGGALLGGALLGATRAAAQDDPTDPASCESLWSAVGLPVLKLDLDEEDVVRVCHKGYITRHNNLTRIPDWVIQHMTAEQVSGSNTRPSTKFKPEPEAPEDQRAVDDDYKHSDYARGHQAASADYSFDVAFMTDTFFFSNAVPQEGHGFNSGTWSRLEDLVRHVAQGRGELFVITGPVYQDSKGRTLIIKAEQNPCGNEIHLPQLEKQSICDANDDDAAVPCEAGVAVPSALFKILFDPQNRRSNAFLMPNLDHRPLKGSESHEAYLDRYRVSVALVEDFAGFDFFPGLSLRDQRILEESCMPTFRH